ncbi:MAG: DUF2808 domain-containing protein [Xenococcus sp. (in: cyanobacteria)]
MKNLSLSLLILAAIISPNLTLISRASESQYLISQQTNFVQSPRLVDSHTTFSGIRVRQAIYYFDIEIPDDAVGSLKKVSFDQRQGAEQIEFRLDKTKAFEGNYRRKQESIALADVSQDEATNTINVTFSTPIEPGSRITIGLKPKINPDLEGFYLFGVTAFPTGEEPTGLYLGVARFYFEQGSDDSLD